MIIDLSKLLITIDVGRQRVHYHWTLEVLITTDLVRQLVQDQ